MNNKALMKDLEFSIEQYEKMLTLSLEELRVQWNYIQNEYEWLGYQIMWPDLTKHEVQVEESFPLMVNAIKHNPQVTSDFAYEVINYYINNFLTDGNYTGADIVSDQVMDKWAINEWPERIFDAMIKAFDDNDRIDLGTYMIEHREAINNR